MAIDAGREDPPKTVAAVVVALSLMLVGCGSGTTAQQNGATTGVESTTTETPATTTTPNTPAESRPGDTSGRWDLTWTADMTFEDDSEITTSYVGQFDITDLTDPSGAARELDGLFIGSLEGTVVVHGTSCTGFVDVSTGLEGNIAGFWYPDDESFELVLEVTVVTEPKDIVATGGACDGVGFEGNLALQAYQQIGSMPGTPALPREYRTALTPGPVSLRFTDGEPNIHSTIDVTPAGG